MKTRTAELRARRQFRIAESDISDPGPGEVQVRVAAVGICGSDIHSYAEGSVGDTPCLYPMVIGHEPAGVVVRTGAGVTGWQAGARAALEPALYCYHCEFCLTGRHNVCANIRFMSLPGEPGFFREYANLPARNLLAIPDEISLQQATLVEPLAVAVHSMQFVGLKPGETAVIFGAGPIGLLTAILLKLSGARRVWMVDPVPHRRELARAAGADALLNPADEDPVQEILRETANRGVDVAIDCAAKPGTANQCIGAVRNAGRVVFTGIPSEVEVPLEFHTMRRKELTLFNVRRSNQDSARALDLLTAHMDRFAPLITHTRPLDRIGAAFSMMEKYEDGVGKIVIDCG